MANYNEYDEEITPQQNSSSISKSLGSTAITLGMFLGGSMLAAVAYRTGKGKLFTHLAQHSKQFGAAAKYAQKYENSLTAFISHGGKGASPTGLSGIAELVHGSSHNAVFSNVKDSMKGLSRLEKFRTYKGLSGGDKAAFQKGVAGKYIRETAFFAPTFYAMDQAMGHGMTGPHNREQPAWYNLPGHAIGFMKFLPIYLTGDAIFRGGHKLIGAGLGRLAEGAVKNMPRGFQEGISKTANWFTSGKYLDQQILGRPLKDYAAQFGAGVGAFHRVVGEGRRKLYSETQTTKSKYRKTGNSIRNIYKRTTEDFYEKKSHLYQTALKKYKQRKQRMNQNSEFAVRDNFDDFLQFMGTGTGESLYAKIMGISDYAASGRGFIHKQFYNESDRMPYMAKLLGLRRARGSDYRHKKVLGDVYDKLKMNLPEGRTKVLKEKNKDEFINNLVSKNMYIHEGTGKMVDLAPMSGKYWTSKMLYSNSLVLGGKFSLADLFPFKVMAQQDEVLHRIIPQEEFAAIGKANQTRAWGQSPWRKKSLTGSKAVLHSNIYRFQRTPGLLTRKAGDKSYDLFAEQKGQWNRIGKNLKAALVSDSPKMANVYIQGLIRQTQPPVDRLSTPSSNPMISFMQKNFSLLDNEGARGSWFGALRRFMPDDVNKLLDSRSRFPASSTLTKNTLTELSQLGGTNLGSLTSTRSASTRVAYLLSRTNSLGNKLSKETFGETLSQDRFMGRVIDFLDNQGVLKTLSKGDGRQILSNKALADDDTLMNIASTLFKRLPKDEGVNIFGETAAVDRIIKGVKATGRGLEDRGGIETPKQKIKRFIYEYAVHHSNINRLDENHIVNILRTDLSKAGKEGVVSDRQLAKIDFAMFSDKLRYKLKGIIPENMFDPEAAPFYSDDTIRTIAESIGDKHQTFLNLVKSDLIDQKALAGRGSAMDELLSQTKMFDTVYSSNVNFTIDDVTRAANQVKNANPFVVYPKNLKDQAGLGMGWALNTVNNLLSFTGLGWDAAKYPGVGDVAALWGKRLGAYTLGSIAYNAADTFVDTSGLFDFTFLDEGITVAAADQAVKMRMGAGWVYDKLGLDNASRHMEGLMPGSTKVIPGAALGFSMGGVKGAVVGGILNAYIQPQLAEGPLGFLAAAPPLAPFVTDMTKDFNSLRNIYEGKELIPVRKGRGWSLGLTPIAGGKVERYEPGWYPRLKSQYQAGPELYGSKLEQFLAKDIPFVDFSLMDIVDPHYLEKKHYHDRPFHVPSTVFSEVPVVGPMLGATVGQLYNKLHPMALGNEMHANEATKAYMKGQAYNWKGESLGTYGPQYQGFMGNFTGMNTMAGGGANKHAVMSPNSIQPLIGEQLYRGWIEPLGLPGFITSAALWGGDEPFTDTPVAQSANLLSSQGRDFWDAGFGDLMGTTELLRRAIPRPRTSFESVNILQNQMPGWMPDDFKQGDPYCLTPDTLVETTEGLYRADEIKEDMLVKTLYGRYYPVQAIKTREVNEEIYEITINGLQDFPIKVTGGHPFYINEEWIFAKDLTESHLVTYPLLNIDLPSEIPLDKEMRVEVNGAIAYTLGLLSRWTDHRNINKLRIDTPKNIIDEIDAYKSSLLKDSITNELIEDLQNTGPLLHFGTIDLPILLNYLKPFITGSKNKNIIKFAMHTTNAAYTVWSLLLQNKITSKINKNIIEIDGTSAVEVGFFLGLNINYRNPSSIKSIFDMNRNTTKHGPIVQLEIQSINKIKYSGLVYAIDVGDDATFTIPGAAVHNSKIGRGELLLPGKSYESFFNPRLTFPTGPSQLGATPYDQSLKMIGLGEHIFNGGDDMEDILETGTAMHGMIQDQLMYTGLATRIEALVSDVEHNIKGFVDVMYRDPRSGQEQPLEIKSIGGKGLYKLDQPKWKHKIQLNSYMAMLGVTSGKLLYVSRDDPSQTKEFTVRFNPNLWESSKGDLAEARMLATEYLEQGYGHAMEGYSYIDRLQVLLNASPYSRKFRETSQLVQQQQDLGYLSLEEEEQFSTLQKQHTSMLRKYEMYPRRFKVSDLMNPDTEYNNLSDNENIQPASNYSMVERVLGSAWESFTHMRSPVHTKLIGHYSPEEMYENTMIRGEFASWTDPWEGFLKPYGRGLRATADPLQGALSWGMGGSLLGGGIPGALAGTAFGLTYGSMHGLYRKITGTHYTPDSFKDRERMQEYFDRIEFSRAQAMYQATGDRSWRKEMVNNPYGWTTSGGGNSFNFNAPISPSVGFASRASNQAYSTIGSPDRGFRSPYGGQDSKRSLDYSTNDINIYNAFSALPPWDRPFWTAFLDTPEDERENLLGIVDNQMGAMLQTAWGKGEEVAMPNMEDYFTNNYKPTNLHPLMDPTTNIRDYQAVTVEDEGMNAHDFGLGWRDQLRRIANSPFAITPISLNTQATGTSPIRADLSRGELRDTITKILERMGYAGANVMVNTIPAGVDETTVVLNVKRASTGTIIDNSYG